MKEANDISNGRWAFTLSKHSEPYLVRGIWQQNRENDDSIHSYLPFDCLDINAIWAKIKDQYNDIYRPDRELWLKIQTIIKEGIEPVWSALELAEVKGKLGCYIGKYPICGYNAWDWIEFGEKYDSEHGSSCFNEHDYMALIALSLQNGVASWIELVSSPTTIIGAIDWPTPIGCVKLFGDVTPYGNLMRQLVNPINPEKPLLAGFRYDNYAYNFSNSYASTIFEDDFPDNPHNYAGGIFKLTKNK